MTVQAVVSNKDLAAPFHGIIKVVPPRKVAAKKLLVASRVTDDLLGLGRDLRDVAAEKRFLFLPGRGRPEDLMAAAQAVHAVPSRALFVTGNEADILRRWAFCWSAGTMDAVIHAFWEDDALVMIAPDFRRLKIALSDIPALRGLSKRELDDFEVSETGSFLHWPRPDVHLGWEMFDLSARLKDRSYCEWLGQQLREYRVKHGLTQDDVGIGERQVRRMEAGLITPRSIDKLARSQELSRNQLLYKIIQSR